MLENGIDHLECANEPSSSLTVCKCAGQHLPGSNPATLGADGTAFILTGLCRRFMKAHLQPTCFGHAATL